MQTREWTTIDKTAWGEGPWTGEPDKRQFEDEATGLPCLVVRNHHGSLCGYVGVTEGHPVFGLSGDTAEVAGLEVHGGITYADFCQEGLAEDTICHIPDPGEPDRVWWTGFDCGHTWDYWPARKDVEETYARLVSGKRTYRTLAYVTEECRSLAQQLKALEGG